MFGLHLWVPTLSLELHFCALDPADRLHWRTGRGHKILSVGISSRVHGIDNISNHGCLQHNSPSNLLLVLGFLHICDDLLWMGRLWKDENERSL